MSSLSTSTGGAVPVRTGGPGDRLRALYELSDRAARAASVDEVVEATLDAIVRTGLAPRASVLLFDRDGVMRFRAAMGLSPAYQRAVEGHTPWRPDTPDAAPIVVPDVASAADLAAYRPVFEQESIRSLAFIPLAHDRRVLGKFMLYHAEPHVYSDDEVRLAQTIAGHVSTALARKAVERDLRVQARVLESMVEGVSVADADGVITYTNPAEDRIFGYERGELIGKHVTVLNAYESEENARRVRAVIARLQEQGYWEGDWANVRKDGTALTTHARITRIEMEGRPYFVCVQEDVTDRRRADEALRESEERFRVLADIVPQIVFTALPDGFTDYYNERWFEFTGMSRETIDGWSWRDVLHPDDAISSEVWKEAMRTGKPYEVQYRFRRADGQYRWHLARARPMRDASGQIVRWFGTATDIHDQKLAEEALRESEERFRLLSNSSPVGIFLALPSGEAQYTNPSCDRICGFTGDGMGYGWTQYVHPEDKPRVMESWLAYVGDPRASYASEFRWLHADGTVRHTNVRAAPVLRGDEILGHVGTVEDITDIRKAAEELDRTRAQLAHNEKLSALGSLVGGVAHELRTPLTYLANNLSIVELNLERALREMEPARADALRARIAPSFEEARESIDRIDRLVQDLRKYTRLKPGGERQAVGLDRVVREAVDLFRATHRGQVKVVDELLPTTPVRLDRVQVQQIAINLLENAYEAKPRDATVRIATHADVTGGATLVVSDRGEGIPQEVQERMFDPFYTTKAHGSGLGLSIVRRIAEEHGAQIEVDSTPGEGTTFRIRFPRA